MSKIGSRGHIFHFSRGVIIGLEAVGVIGCFLIVAWVCLLLRLSQGPMNIDFLTDRIESSFNGQKTGFVFDIGAAELAWGGKFEPLELSMQDVRVAREDLTPVLTIKRVGIELSKRYLVLGQVVPKKIHIYSPALRVIRHEDDHFSLNAGNEESEVNADNTDGQQQVQFFSALLNRLYKEDDMFLLGGLREIKITDATLLYEDRILQTYIRPEKADIVIARAERGILANTVFTLGILDGQKSIIKSSVYYNGESGKVTSIASFTGLNLQQIIQKSPVLQKLGNVNLPFKGSVSVDLDEHFSLDNIRFALGADPGTSDIAALYPAPVEIKDFYLSGQYFLKKNEGGLDQVKIDLGGPKIEGKASLSGQHIELDATLTHMPIGDLKTYWPEALAPDPRAWVTGHLSKGIADQATLNLKAVYDSSAEKKIVLEDVKGAIDFHGIKVDYFEPLQPVTDATGKATYDKSSFTIAVSSGVLDDMKVKKADIHITDLDKQDHDTHAWIDIDADVEGPLTTALAVLDSKPLQYPEKLGLDIKEAKGAADVDVNFHFPLHKKLSLEEVKVKANADLKDVYIAKTVAGYPLSGGPLKVDLSGGELKISGSGNLDQMPVTFDWAKSFSDKSDFAGKLQAKIDLTADALTKFGAPADLKLEGKALSEIDYILNKDETSVLDLKADITPISFTIPHVGFTKVAGTAGAIAFRLFSQKDVHQKMSGFSVESENLALKGDIDFTGNGTWHAVFNNAKIGDNLVSFDGNYKGEEGYQLKVSGAQLDISDIFKDQETPKDRAVDQELVPPLRIGLDIQHLVTGKDKGLDQVKMFLHKNAFNRIEQLEIDGVAGGKPLYVRYMPEPVGHSLKLEAQNAGAALRALGIVNSIRGGILNIDGKPVPKSGLRDMKGTAVLKDFTLKDIPVLAKLLNAMSLIGIVDLLNGEGISFKKARANFTWTDKGRPYDDQNVRLIKISDGETSGASLGLTFEGKIDNWKNIYDLNGTIVPVSDLNKLLKVIPLVGNILTAGGEGVIAATYKIEGPKDQPEVSVNPLSVLAPGILRKLFFEH